MFKKIGLLFILLTSVLFAGKFPVSSIEYSISLKNEKFKNGVSDIEKYQNNFFNNLSFSKILDKNIKLEKEGIVSYWDTKDRLFRKQNLIVRHRGNGKKFEITLKFRGDSQEKAENWNLSTKKKSKSKTEIDRYLNKDVYSRSITVKTKAKLLSSKMLLDICPQLKDYGLTKKTVIQKVNNFVINTASYKIGKYYFGKKNAKKKTTTSSIDLAIWSCKNGKIIATEVSWKIKNQGIKSVKALGLSFELLKTLSKDKEWAELKPTTKTSIVYDKVNICYN